VFSRSHQGQSVVVIAPRLLAGLSELANVGHDDTNEQTASERSTTVTADDSGLGPDAGHDHDPGPSTNPRATASSNGDIDPLQDPGWDETWISIPAARLEDVLGGMDSGAESRAENRPGGGPGNGLETSPETSPERSTNARPNRQLETEQYQGRQALRASRVLRRFPVGLLKTSAL
ncbi:MAG: hypothetical protein VBE63_29425, partial [Lamprobacter sp.]|uniref:hypothetical protein n=1 Tax=Lamprobacter sp. TaxID=3100796 RepID=UPI002B263CDD